jgi:hypothetical protein
VPYRCSRCTKVSANGRIPASDCVRNRLRPTLLLLLLLPFPLPYSAAQQEPSPPAALTLALMLALLLLCMLQLRLEWAAFAVSRSSHSSKLRVAAVSQGCRSS